MKKTMFLFVFLLGFILNANAHTKIHKTPEEFILHILEVDIQELISADVSEKERFNAFLPFMKNNFDIKYLLKLILRGKPWRKATNSEKNKAIALLRERVAKIYIKNFEKMKNGKVIIKKVTHKRSFSSVKTEIIFTSGLVLNVGFDVTKTTNVFKIKDIIVERLRIAPSIRSHFRRSVKKNGIQGLIRQLHNEIE